MADFQSIGSGIRSLFMILFSLLWYMSSLTGIYGLIDFAILSAVWSDPWAKARGLLDGPAGRLPARWLARCLPLFAGETKFAWFGPYPSEELCAFTSPLSLVP